MPMPRKPSSGSAAAATSWILVGLVGAMLTAWGIRSLLVATIFLPDGFVLLGLDDSAYHARRALYSFVNFPAVLLFDPYMAYPDGSPIPFPPLYDWALGGVARLFGHTERVFETVAAWAAVFLATSTVLPVYGLGRRLLGPRVGLAAAWIFAVLPASSLLSSVGYLDHHAAVSFLGACWLWSSIREIVDAPGRRVAWAVLHAAIVAAMTLVWSGSLLYIGLGEGARLLVGGILWCRRDRLLAQSGAALLAAALVVPSVALAPTPLDGPFSSTALSWLQVTVLIALGVLAATLAGLERLRPETRTAMRALRAVAATLAIALPLLAIPGLRNAVANGITFVSGEDVWAANNPEQQPLFSSTGEAFKRSPAARFGWLVLLVPALPLLVASALRRREQREQTVLLLIWTTALTVLALRQVRFAHDLAPLASVVFAGTLAVARGGMARVAPPHLASAASVALGVTLLWPALSEVHLPRARWALQRLVSGPEPEGTPLSPWESEVRFALAVREATPETSGFLDLRTAPEYGLLVDPSLGHSFVYWARRPVPANNFGPYLDREKFDDATRFYREVDATLAVEALDRLGARFVVTGAGTFVPPMPYGQRLHRGDGFRGGDPVCGPCLRLVSEGPMYGTPGRSILSRPSRRSFIPYKLFERVAGARVEIEAHPGTPVRLELDLQTPVGRSFVFEVGTEAAVDGWARLRVPYATDVSPPVHARGPYRVRLGDTLQSLEVSDEAVRSGATLTLRTPPATPEAAGQAESSAALATQAENAQ